MDTQLDPTVVALAKAIRQTESSGNPTAKGKSGEFGAYQYTPDTWAKDAASAGVSVPLEQSTLQQQNEVAYKKLKALKDAGNNVGQIASIWNAGENEPNAYQGTFSDGSPSVGVNKSGAHFDVPAYAKSVATAYQTLKQGGQVGLDPNNPSSVANTNPQAGYQNQGGFVNPNQPSVANPNAGSGTVQPPATSTNVPSQPAQPQQSLLSKIGHGLAGFANSIEKPFIDLAATPVQGLAKATGQPDPYAQGVPGVAGNIDVNPLNLEKKVGSALQVGSYFVPGEGVLGAAGMGVLQGAGSAMSEGQDLGGVLGQGAIGGVVGAGTAGLLKGAGALLEKGGNVVSGKAAEDAVSGIKNAYSSALNLGAGERAFEQRTGKDLAQVLLDNQAPLGRYENGTLDATGAIEKLQTKLDPLNEQAQQLLSRPQGVVRNISFDDTLQQVTEKIQKLNITQAEKNAAIEHAREVIAAEAKHVGPEVTPEIADKIKQGFWGSVFNKTKLAPALDKLKGNVNYLTGNVLKTQIEDAVAGTDTGVSLKALNEERSKLIDAIKRLTNLDGVKAVRGGRLGNALGGIAGAVIGSSSGGPLGGLAGDYFGTKAAEFLNNPETRIGIAKNLQKGLEVPPKVLGRASKPIGKATALVGRTLKKSARLGGLIGNQISNPR